MSGDKFAKTQPGRPLEIPAPTWNAMVDAARAHAQHQHDQETDSDIPFRQGDIVKVRNQTGKDLSQFEVLGLTDPIIDPSVKLREFKNQVALKGITPTDDHAGQFLILLDPLRDNRIGRGWVSGVCPARINVEEDWHEYADVSDGSTSELKTKPAGAAQIIWREPGLGLKWAVVRLSNAHRTHFLAKVPASGIPARFGSQTGSADCELYTIDEDGEIEPVLRPVAKPFRLRRGIMVSSRYAGRSIPMSHSTLALRSTVATHGFSSHQSRRCYRSRKDRLRGRLQSRPAQSQPARFLSRDGNIRKKTTWPSSPSPSSSIPPAPWAG